MWDLFMEKKSGKKMLPDQKQKHIGVVQEER